MEVELLHRHRNESAVARDKKEVRPLVPRSPSLVLLFLLCLDLVVRHKLIKNAGEIGFGLLCKCVLNPRGGFCDCDNPSEVDGSANNH